MNSSKSVSLDILGVPIDLGSNPLGVEMGPTAMRYAGLLEALAFNSMDYSDHGDLPVDRESCGNGSLEEIVKVCGEVSRFVQGSMMSGRLPLVIGGDHSLSIGTVAGAAALPGDLGLLWLDCHPDANTPETSPSGNVHGMTVAVSLGIGFDDLINVGGFHPKVKPENVCIVGAKDIDQAEIRFLQDHGVRTFTLFDIEKRGIVEVFDEAIETISTGTDAVHVSFDVDVLDPVIAPGTGILTKGGLSYREISYIMKSLGQLDVVRSMDVIEINPLLDIRNQTAELCVELILSALGGSYGDYERNYLKGME